MRRLDLINLPPGVHYPPPAHPATLATTEFTGAGNEHVAATARAGHGGNRAAYWSADGQSVGDNEAAKQKRATIQGKTTYRYCTPRFRLQTLHAR